MKATAFDRIKKALLGLVEAQTARIDMLAFYPAKVVSQNGDGTLELQPDNAAVPGVSKVPIRLGVPGFKVKVSGGSRVLLSFEGGDARRPVATLWEFDGAKLTELAIGDAPANFLALANLVKTALDDLQSKFNNHTHAETGTTTNVILPAQQATASTNVASSTVKST